MIIFEFGFFVFKKKKLKISTNRLMEILEYTKLEDFKYIDPYKKF